MVQAQVPRDVFTIHVCIPLLSRVRTAPVTTEIIALYFCCFVSLNATEKRSKEIGI